MSRKLGSDDLYRLIHSLSNVEVRYFREFARRHIEKDVMYLKLFNAIHAQKAFEEHTLKAKFKGFAVMKVYLFELVMKSLLQNAENSDRAKDLSLQLVYCGILFKRGLYNKSVRLAEKGLKAARKNEFFFLEDGFLELLYNNKKLFHNPAEVVQNARGILADMEKTAQKRAALNKYREEQIKIYMRERNFPHKDTFTNAPFPEIDVEALENQKAAFTPLNDSMRRIALARYYTTISHNEKAYHVSRELYEADRKIYLEGTPAMSFRRYMNVLELLLSLCIDTCRIKEGTQLLQKESKIKPAGSNDQMYQFFMFLKYQCIYYWLSGKHKEGEEFVNARIDAIMNPEYSTLYDHLIRAALAFKIQFEFSNGHFSQAYLTSNDCETIYTRQSDFRNFKGYELMRIFIQIEQGNFELANTFTRNLIRKKRPLRLSAFEMAMLRKLKNMNRSNQKNILNELLACYDSYNTDEDATIEMVLLYFGWRDWIETKLTGTPLAKIISNDVAGRVPPLRG